MVRCDFGGHAVTGRYYSYESGAVVCESHDREGRRCARCGVPSPALTAVGRLAVCASCSKKIVRCSLCGQPAVAVRTYRDRPDRAYCASCASSSESCDFCGHPVGGSKALKDGRHVCPTCRAQLVLEPARAKKLYEQVRGAVEEHCGVVVKVEVGFKVVSPGEMAALVGQVFSPTHALDVRPLGLFVRRGASRTLHLESELPRTTLITTAAHELGHAWQSQYCAEPVVPLLAEGFSEWVAHRIAMKAKFRDEARRIEIRPDVYGEGFRVVMRLVRKVGISEMLNVVRDRLERGVASK
jgi:hypothetical protein